jgi:hypothetical protein
MKSNYTSVLLIALTFLLGACKPEYKVSVVETNKVNAPSLQSFVHGFLDSEWLLFAGRTNSKTTFQGGLHDLDSNYTNTSFIPTSFNDSIYVYNVDNDVVINSISVDEMVLRVATNFPSYDSILKANLSVFENTNALVRQSGEFLYVVGGFGPNDIKKPTTNYITYNQVAKIHVPSLIHLAKGNFSAVKKEILFAFGQNESLISTGGELLSINNTMYMVTGHNFGNNAPNFQKYVDAVYPFTAGPKIVNKDTIKHVLSISMGVAITDVTNPTDPIADNLSVFRRRDGPIAPAIYKSKVNGVIEQGIAIYAGVFKPGNDNNLQAWNDAIYAHPSWSNDDNKIYSYDATYNQNNYNVRKSKCCNV